MGLARPIKVLVIGNGGREHALCWKIAQSPWAEEIYCAPGNGGTAVTGGVHNVEIAPLDFPAIIDFSSQESIDLIVVGPDNPLAEGIVDALEGAGLRVFGPSRQAARLEWSKAYAKDFMASHGIPTARYAVCRSLEVGEEILRDNPWARVVKVDGLALGKGVFVCEALSEAREALSLIFEERRFGDSGDAAIIEERLAGQEISLLTLCDGKRLVPLVPSVDHKRRFDDDKGPNTGGMGAYAPVGLYRICEQEIEARVLAPVRQALESGELVYKGVLYFGLMITSQSTQTAETPSAAGPFRVHVLEFNARFGDPETQAVLPLLKSDLLSALWACTEGRLDQVKLEWSAGAACCVVATGSGYPEGSSHGEPIQIGDLPPNTVAFHAGTRLADGQIVTNGGRIISVSATGDSLHSARESAYAGMAKVSFAGMDYRRDIAMRALAACQST